MFGVKSKFDAATQLELLDNYEFMIAFGKMKQQLGSQLGTVRWLWSVATGESIKTIELPGRGPISVLSIINCTIIIFLH